MFRFNLIQKHSRNKDSNLESIQYWHRHTKSERQILGMREVQTFLKSKSSAISSLSFSSTGGDCDDESKEKRSEYHENVPINTSLGTESKGLKLSSSSTVFKASKTCEGRLIARIVPTKYSSYDTQKPLAQTDPAPFITSFLSWQMQNKRDADSKDAERSDGSHQRQQKQRELMPLSDEESVVVLDLYLLRSAYLDEPRKTKTIYDGGEEEDINESLQQRREQRVRSLMSSFDVTRNDSSHRKNVPKTRGLRTLPTADVSTTAPGNVESAVSTSSSIADGKSIDLSSNNLFFLHMNRSSSESAVRTLRRLELSTTRKLQSLNPFPNKGSPKRVNRGKEGNLALIHEKTTSKLVIVEDTSVTDMKYREVDLTGWSSAEILRMFSSRGISDGAVALTIPKAIVPWDNIDDGGDATIDSAHSSCSTSLFKTVETINLGITSNPPTLLTIHTSENFTGNLFTCVPLVVETTVIHATHAIITWFVGGQVALHDSKMYTPTAADIGKVVSILVTPIRVGNSGNGCQEAYSFSNPVKPLPTMPIMELRDEWCRIRSGRSYMENNLRVVTYNILADLYAGREIESHLMYGHCDIQDLLRQRRMPMIIAEILSYKADIICLQEVDAAVHESLLRPVLEANGYQGYYSNKVSSQQEGCSMFWSTATFDIVPDDGMRAYPLRSLLTQNEGDIGSIYQEKELPRHSSHYYDAKSNVKDFELERWESMNGIKNLFESHDEVRKVYKESVGQIVQIVRLSPKRPSRSCTPKPESIVVANSHLFYHPMADHIRVLQAYAVCHKLDEIRREGQYPDPVLIVGDLNSSPLSGAVRLLTHRSVLPNESDCWENLNVYRWQCGGNEYMIDHGYIGCSPGEVVDPCYVDEEFVDAQSSVVSSSSNASTEDDDLIVNTDLHPPTIELPSSFPVLTSGCLTVPQFTNYAVDFVETLDYVFASKPSSEREPFGFQPRGEAPMLTEAMVKKYVAMPNEVMPSDHVAVVCDFEWVKNKNMK